MASIARVGSVGGPSLDAGEASAASRRLTRLLTRVAPWNMRIARLINLRLAWAPVVVTDVRRPAPVAELTPP